MYEIASGVYPTMLAAFTEENKIDYKATEQLIEWYIKKGVHGIFALCQSTEIHKLSFKERYELGKFVLDVVDGRVDVVMSGNIESDVNKATEEALMFAELKPDALVFLRNRMNGTEGFKKYAQHIMDALPQEMPLGIYECPQPIKEILSDDEFEFLVKSGRFAFLKDTTCDMEIMKRRADIANGTSFKLYNANSATVLESIRNGYHGFSGVMANFHPELYVWMYENKNDNRADLIDKYLSVMSVIECRSYPICAKRYLRNFENISITDVCRSAEDNTVPAVSFELNALHELSELARKIINE